MAKRMGSKKNKLLWKCNLLFVTENGHCIQTQLLTKNRGESPRGRHRPSQGWLPDPSSAKGKAFLSPGTEGRKWKWQRQDLHLTGKERKCNERYWVSGLCNNDPVKACCKHFMFAVTQLTGGLNSSPKFVNYLPFSFSDFFQEAISADSVTVLNH